MRRYFYKVLPSIFIIFLTIGAGSETALRSMGFASFPLYDIAAEPPYIPSANQRGVFMNRNAWYFNDRHMGNISDWTPDQHPNILLIGNSIVLGGLPYDHEAKLGPQLERALGGGTVVWSIAAGGWTTIDEMAYLDRNQDVLRNSDLVVLEYMTGGLSTSSTWPGFLVLPDRKPLFVGAFLAGKYLMRFRGKSVSDSGPLPPTGRTEASELVRFQSLISSMAATKRVVIFLYPKLGELPPRSAWDEDVAPIHDICHTFALTCVDLAHERAWTAKLYKEDGVHPTVEGNKVLAGLLASAIQPRNWVDATR